MIKKVAFTLVLERICLCYILHTYIKSWKNHLHSRIYFPQNDQNIAEGVIKPNYENIAFEKV